MKLVTGIEAIQSGKPWKHKDVESWIFDETALTWINPKDLREKMFVIKEEPREFWINASLTDKGCEHCGMPISSTKIIDDGDNWIRVREVDPFFLVSDK